MRLETLVCEHLRYPSSSEHPLRSRKSPWCRVILSREEHSFVHLKIAAKTINVLRYIGLDSRKHLSESAVRTSPSDLVFQAQTKTLHSSLVTSCSARDCAVHSSQIRCSGRPTNASSSTSTSFDRRRGSLSGTRHLSKSCRKHPTSYNCREETGRLLDTTLLHFLRRKPLPAHECIIIVGS